MYRRISVPVDGTSHSMQALSLAVGIARQAACPVELVRVAYPTTYGNELYAVTLGDAQIDELRRDAQESLERAAADVEAHGVPVRTAVLDGPIPHALAEHFQSSGADLVVMTTHDRGRLERLLIGSVAESVVRHVHVPVLLVHAHDDAPTLTEAPPIRRILVALDGSAFGDEVIPHAANLARLMRADITLLTVIQPLLAAVALATETGTSRSIAQPSPEDIERADSSELVSQELEETADSLRRSGATVHAHVISDGNPSRAIVEYARHHDMDLIAMTTHGRGALGRLVAGSVSTTVLHGTHTPTLLYRPEM